MDEKESEVAEKKARLEVLTQESEVVQKELARVKRLMKEGKGDQSQLQDILVHLQSSLKMLQEE